MSAEVIGKCPVCGGDVVESDRGFGCANWRENDGNCKFVIWKKFYDKKITNTMVKSLLSKGKTHVIKGWKSRKTGKEFEAALKLEPEGKYYRVSFLFEKAE